MNPAMREVIVGALGMGFAVAGLFFLRFWRESGDRLFLFFALAFFVLAVNRVAFVVFAPNDAFGDYPYWIRLLAFAMILLAILDKNFIRTRSGA
jgi:hypothetical protein